MVAGAAITVTLLAASVLSTTFAIDARRERDAAQWQAYVASVADAIAAYESGEYRRLRRRLEAAPAAHRGWEWHFLRQLANEVSALVSPNT